MIGKLLKNKNNKTKIMKKILINKIINLFKLNKEE